jgi:hypothetical protein
VGLKTEAEHAATKKKERTSDRPAVENKRQWKNEDQWGAPCSEQENLKISSGETKSPDQTKAETKNRDEYFRSGNSTRSKTTTQDVKVKICIKINQDLYNHGCHRPPPSFDY